MGNRFNYRCPKCGSPDDIEIYVLVPLRLTSNGTEIADDVKDIMKHVCGPLPPSRSAGCAACGFQGAVKDFEPSGGATIIDLFPRQASRR